VWPFFFGTPFAFSVNNADKMGSHSLMLILAYILGFLALASYLSGATEFLGMTRGLGASMTAFFMFLSLASLITAMFRKDRLKKTHDLP
jgi:hypothetical protein